MQIQTTSMNENKPTILIIGASSGLGRETALYYARQGYKVGVCARRSEPLAALAAECPQNIHWTTLDVTAHDCRERLMSFIDRLGGIDIALYAAGCGWNNPNLNVAEDNRTVQTNVVGFTTAINALFDYFADRQGHTTRYKPQLCAITSIAGTKGIGISATYSASKRYETTYLEALSQLAKYRKIAVDITDIRPGFIDTALLDTTAHRYPMLMSVDYAAKRIVRAINRRKRVAYVDWRWHIVVMLWRLIPRWLWTRLKLSI